MRGISTSSSDACESAGALGPVSAALLALLGEEARKHGAVLWLDRDGTYSALVDRLLAEPGLFPHPLFAFRGSFLELLLALDGHEDGTDAEPLVIHLPGFVEDDVHRSPLLELYRLGYRFRVALDRLLRDAADRQVPPAAVEAALAQGIASLDAADRWLASEMRRAGGGDIELEQWFTIRGLYDDLVGRGPVASRLHDARERAAIDRYLARMLGLERDWWSAGRPGEDAAEDLRLRLSTYALCVEFTHDLQREPRAPLLQPLRRLPKGAVLEARALAAHLRDRHDVVYSRDADEVESRLADEVREATADDLGKIDTLRFEDRKVFEAALRALVEDRFAAAAGYAAQRTEAQSFWVRHDPARQAAWTLVDHGATLGLACVEHGALLRGANSLDACAERYARQGYAIDLAQRRLEQARGALQAIRLDDLPDLLRGLDHVRELYRRTVDQQSLAFQEVCRQHGFLPEPALRQRELFEDVVRPLADGGGAVAYFLVDALRFEMGQQLAEQIQRDGPVRLSLKPRFAELPSVTEVGMNALAPVAVAGRLRLELTDNGMRGFRLGEARIGTPDARRRAMHERVGGETCPLLALEELLALDLTGIRRKIARARLIVVHAEGIDKAGEKGVGLQTFEGELQRLRAAWGRLRDAGVQRFVMTADHGFLIQDATTLAPLAHGRKTDPKRRHVIRRDAGDVAGTVRVSSAELGYDGDEVHFVFPATTAPFDTGERTKEFLHGGNSLQERIIPVIVAEYRAARGGGAEKYRLDAWADAPVMGLHCVRGKVSRIAGDTGLLFGGRSDIELRLRVVDDTDVAVELIGAEQAILAAGALVASVDREFKLLFRLTGGREARSKIELCGATGADDVEAVLLERRFTVDVVRMEPAGPSVLAAVQRPSAASTWIEEFDEEGVREVFRHIERFGAINEADATQMLGSPRKFRRFSQRFDEYAAKAPFGMRIDVSSGQKRYVREGGSP